LKDFKKRPYTAYMKNIQLAPYVCTYFEKDPPYKRKYEAYFYVIKQKTPALLMLGAGLYSLYFYY